MRVLVTGGVGFIGSHLVENFNGNAGIVVLDNLRSGLKHNIQDFDVEFIEASIADRNIVKKAVKGVDYIFHLAAMISVPESMFKPTECVEINTQGALNVLAESAEAGVKKLVLSSSAAIYGDNPVVPKLETMLPEPKSPYVVTKLDGEYRTQIIELIL
jgi:UDP-glucose 4-epimerase